MNIYITFDYELFFGNKSGSAEKCLIEPTNLLMEMSKRYNIKFVFFVDSGYLIKLKEYKNKYNYVMHEYNLVFKQLNELSKDGHEIALHIHPHWEDSYFDGKEWIMNVKRYRLHQFSDEEINNIVYEYKKILTEISSNEIISFRAGGWSVQPFNKIKEALKMNDIKIDSSVFYGGYYNSVTHFFDFRKAPKKDLWKFEDDVLIENDKGSFIEVPISSIQVSPFFYWRFAYYKKFGKNDLKIFGDGVPVGASNKDVFKMLLKPTYSVVSCDGFRSNLLEQAYKYYIKNKYDNFVIIGHPKGQSRFSLRNLENFLINKKNNIKKLRDVV